jgi:small nuclear ribonucleoprotein (snRNP)-like protein
MIIQTPYKVGDIVSIKLSSGEEMVATLESENSTDVVLRKPLMLVAGQQGAGLAPFMFTVDQDAKYTVKLNNIICIVKTAKDAASTYTQSTTGLTVV